MDPKTGVLEPTNAPPAGPIPGRRRRLLVVAAIALGAGAAAGTAVVVTGGAGQPKAPATPAAPPLKGRPPIAIQLPGRPVRGGEQAVLAAAEQRLPANDVRVRVAKALAAYDPSDRLATVQAIEKLPQKNASVTLALGFAKLWAQDTQGAIQALEATKKLDPYGFYGLRADNVLHPDQLQGYPPYLPPEGAPSTPVAKLQAAVRRNPGSAAAWLRLAAGVQATDRLVAIAAARRAATLDPSAVSPRVALAVLAFDKDNPSTSIGALGTLSTTAPQNAELRFNFGILLLWIKRDEDALAEFRQVLQFEPQGHYAPAARTFISCLRNNRCPAALGQR